MRWQAFLASPSKYTKEIWLFEPKIGVGSGKQKKLRFYFAFRSPCTIFARCEDTDPLTNVS